MRRIWKMVATLMMASIMAGSAQSANYPDHRITLIVPFPAGGGTDIVARVVARGLERQAGQPVVVENVSGAGSTVGAGRAAASLPDGYTLLLASSSAMAISPHVYPRLRYDPFKSFVPIGLATINPFVFVANPSRPYQTLQELISYGRTNPGKLNFGIPGVGTVQRLAVEQLMDEGRFTATLVSYRGANQGIPAVIAGEADLWVDTPVTILELVKAGRLRALATAAAQPAPDMPDVPTTKELGLGAVEARSWHAVFAPAETPADIVASLRQMFSKALQDPEIIAAMRQAKIALVPTNTDQLTDLMKQEHEKYGNLIRAKNIRIEN